MNDFSRAEVIKRIRAGLRRRSGKACRWWICQWPEVVAYGLLCVPTVWAILYLCGVVARGPM